MYLVRTPRFVDKIYRNRIWRIQTYTKEVFLTFDDGPIPQITPWILDLLATHQIKAHFFCVGENVLKYPTIYKRILDEGHQVGNHTFNHVNSAHTNDLDYLNNVNECALAVESNLFRPPYGRLSNTKEAELLAKGYQIIMWDVLSGDFDINLRASRCVDNVIKSIQGGSIVVFHDNIKAIPTLKNSLPIILDQAKSMGYRFSLLKDVI